VAAVMVKTMGPQVLLWGDTKITKVDSKLCQNQK
jgi:hypothetical protein